MQLPYPIKELFEISLWGGLTNHPKKGATWLIKVNASSKTSKAQSLLTHII
jgi:hypothetical protein